MLKDAKIATKVTVGFAISLLVALIVGLMGRQAMIKNYEVGRDLGSNRMPSVYGLEEMAQGMGAAARGLYGLCIRRMGTDTKFRDSNRETVIDGMRQFNEGRRIYEPLPQTPEEARVWQRALPLFEEWQRGVQSFLDLEHEHDSLIAQGHKLDDAIVVQLDARALDATLANREKRLEATKLTKELIRLNYDLATQIVKETEIATSHSSEVILLVLLLGAAIAIAMGFVIVRGVSGAIVAVRRESEQLTDAAMAGQLSVRSNVTAVPPEFRGIVQGLNDILDAVTGPLNVAANYVDRISKGDIPEKITDSYNGDFNAIKNNLNKCVDAVNLLVADASALSKAAIEGKLATRADASKHQGDFRKIVQGVNDTLDAVIGPLNVAADYVDKIAKGNIPPKITAQYNGDFNTIKNNLNECIDALNGLLTSMASMYEDQKVGEIDSFVDINHFQGAYRQLANGVNESVKLHIAAILSMLEVLASYSEGNFAPILKKLPGKQVIANERMDQLRRNLLAVITEAETLSRGAVEGKLSLRADAKQHQGDYRKIVSGINETLDAVVTPVMEATRVMEALANFDLRARMDGQYEGDHARIKNALNSTGKALHDALSQVSEAVEQVSQASGQIASSSQSVAQGASEQASSLEETSASLEEMSGMTKQNADNTIQARSLAQSTKEAAEKGGHAMTRMVDAMEKIRAASEGTAEISKDINDIAFQTNLLALNAAVEAARAGDAGRGFAVVAEEVRNLALRSKEAAKKTEDLIKMSVGHAENGRVISGEVAGSLSEIVSAAGKVNDIVSEIAVASQEQARGIEQVNKAVSEMDKVVQASAANAEESSSAAEELSGQSDELTSLVARFQLERESTQRSVKRNVSTDRRRRSTASIPTRRTTVDASPRAHSNGSNGSRKPTAEELIPFEDDAVMADF